MQIRSLLPDSRKPHCDSVAYEEDQIIISVSSICSRAECPRCGRWSERIHSRYIRGLADLPWQGRRVTVRWQNRRVVSVKLRTIV